MFSERKDNLDSLILYNFQKKKKSDKLKYAVPDMASLNYKKSGAT